VITYQLVTFALLSARSGISDRESTLYPQRV